MHRGCTVVSAVGWGQCFAEVGRAGPVRSQCLAHGAGVTKDLSGGCEHVYLSNQVRIVPRALYER